MLSAMSTNSQRHTRKPRLVAVEPRRLRISPGRLASSAPAPPERVSQLRRIEISSKSAISAPPITMIKVSQAGNFSGELAGKGVADCKRNSTGVMSGIDSTETNLDVAERDQVSFGYGACFAIGDALAVNVGPVGRAGVGYHQRPEIDHLEGCMNF